MALSQFQRELVTDKAELDAKLLRLSKYIVSPEFVGLTADQKDRLVRHRDAMTALSSVLAERIAAFAPAVVKKPVPQPILD